MKAYKYTFSPLRKNIDIVEFEVEEKPKTYIVTSRARGIYYSRIRKDEFDILNGFENSMFSLSSDVSEYIKKLILKENKEIELLEEKISERKEKLYILKNLSLKGGE